MRSLINFTTYIHAQQNKNTHLEIKMMGMNHMISIMNVKDEEQWR